MVNSCSMYVWYIIVLCEIAVGSTQIVFPSRRNIPPPTPCPNQAFFCGGKHLEYPSGAINAIIQAAIELTKSGLAHEKFFTPLVNISKYNRLPIHGYKHQLSTACRSRTELIPRHTRAKTISGKWMYLLEYSAGPVQNVEMVFCQNDGGSCLNENDNPHEDGSTICKQLYKTQKLLAIDQKGEIMVDTFELPSACVCHYKESFGFETFGRVSHKSTNFRPSLPIISIPYKYPDCTNGGIVSQPTKRRFLNLVGPSHTQNRNVRFAINAPNAKSRPRRHPHSSEPFLLKRRDLCTPIQCRDVKFGNLCHYKRSGKSQEYPTSVIRNIMRRNSTYQSPIQFGKFFGQTCKLKEPARIGFRFGFSFDESPVCRGETRYIFPKVAKNVNGTTRFIVNTEEYKQGVTIVECHPEATGASCMYGGTEGLFPDATVCKQKYTRQNLLALSRDAKLVFETFLIPSACVCHLRDPSFFISL